MKEDMENIDKFYIDALSNYEGKTSKRFNINIHLFLLFLKFRKLILAFIILSAIGLASCFGYGLLNDNYIVDIEQKAETGVEIISIPKVDSLENNPSIPLTVPGDEPDNTDSHKAPEVKKQKLETAANINKPAPKVVTPAEIIINKNIMPVLVLESKQVSNLIDDKLLEDIVDRKTVATTIKDKEDSSSSPPSSHVVSNRFSLSLYASPAISQIKLKADNGFDEYINLRRDNESPALSWSAGADIRVHWKQWFVQTGLNYSVYKNNKNYNYNYQVTDSANSYFNYDTIWVWIYDPPNLEYPVMVGIDTVWVLVYEDINVKNNGINEWSYLEIPVLVGYQFNHRKFGFEFATGISMGFLLKSKGSLPKFPDVEGMEELEKDINQTMFNFLLQVGVSYQIVNGWSVIVQPYYKQNLQSVFENNYPIDQRFRAFGLNFGVRVKL